MKIGLMGFDFASSNKGCEALTFSFVNMLTDIYGDDIEITNYSYSELGLIPELYPEINFFIRRPHIKSPLDWFRLKKHMSELDVIFDVTFGDGFSDIYGKKWNITTDILKQIALWSKTPLVLLPQTYGPYKNKLLRNWAVQIVKNATLAFSRDTQSSEEMRIYGCDKVIPATDLAFALPYNKNLYAIGKDKFNVGMNVSSLLWDGGHNIKLKTDYKEYCRKIISHLALQPDVEIHLIPHVIDTQHYEALENDSRVCQLLHDEFPFTILAPNFATPVEAKSYISNMNLFIGARMHATIGAMSSGVPVIPFSYSKKFEGLFGNIQYPYVISGREIDTNTAISLTLNFLGNIEQIESDRAKSMSLINRKLSVIRDEIKRLLVDMA